MFSRFAGNVILWLVNMFTAYGHVWSYKGIGLVLLMNCLLSSVSRYGWTLCALYLVSQIVMDCIPSEYITCMLHPKIDALYKVWDAYLQHIGPKLSSSLLRGFPGSA